MHDRRVSRVITPGTLIDEHFIDPYANNYIMSIHLPSTEPKKVDSEPHQVEMQEAIAEAQSTDEPPVGLAWLDLSTGHFYTQTTPVSTLPSVLSRVCPREVVLDQELESRESHHLLLLLAEDRHLVSYSTRESFPGGLSDWTSMLEAPVPKASAGSFTTEEVEAGGLLLHYVKDRLQGMSMKLQPPMRYERMRIMGIDKNTMRALEIKQTMRDGVLRGSLLHSVRRTTTKGGARLLNEWLSTWTLSFGSDFSCLCLCWPFPISSYCAIFLPISKGVDNVKCKRHSITSVSRWLQTPSDRDTWLTKIRCTFDITRNHQGEARLSRALSR